MDYHETWQNLEVLWYQNNGKYPERIKTTPLGGTFVIGDWSWNTLNKNKEEYIEKEMTIWVALRMNLELPNQLKPNLRYSEMVEMRKDGKTLQQIADVYGLTRERIRQILDGMPRPPKPIKPKPPRKNAVWKDRILNLEIGESFLHDGRITGSLICNVKTAAKRIGRKVQVYKIHSGRIRVTRFC